MEGQSQLKSESVPPESTPSGYTPPPGDYAPPYQRSAVGEPMQSSFPGMKNSANRYRKTDKIVQLISIGLFLMLIGAIVIGIVTITPGPQDYYEEYDDDNDGIRDSDKRDDFNRDRQFYDTMRFIGVLLGTILVNFGMLLIVLALLGGGLVNIDLDKYVRVAMIIIAGLILIFSGLMVGWYSPL